MNRLWHIPPLQLQKLVEGSWRLVHPQLPFLHAKFEPHPDRTSFSICYGTSQTPSATMITVSLVVISFPAILFGSNLGGSERRAAYQCPHWKCARLAFCLNASVVSAREHSSGVLEDFFFAPTFAGGTHSWYTWSPISGNHELGCLILHRVPRYVLNTKWV